MPAQQCAPFRPRRCPADEQYLFDILQIGDPLGVIFRRWKLRGNKFGGCRPGDSQDGETLGLAEPRTRCVAFDQGALLPLLPVASDACLPVAPTEVNGIPRAKECGTRSLACPQQSIATSFESLVVEPPLGVVVPVGAGGVRQSMVAKDAEFHRGGYPMLVEPFSTFGTHSFRHASESGRPGRPPLDRRQRKDGNLFGSYH